MPFYELLLKVTYSMHLINAATAAGQLIECLQAGTYESFAMNPKLLNGANLKLYIILYMHAQIPECPSICLHIHCTARLCGNPARWVPAAFQAKGGQLCRQNIW